MSDTHERPTLPLNTEQEHPYAGMERFWESEVDRLKSRSRSSRKVAVGSLGLLAEMFLISMLAIAPYGFDPLLYTLGFIAALVACVSSLWLLGQGLGGLRDTRRLPPPRQHRSIRGSRHQTEGSEQNIERQLLEVIERHGEITPARAALQTSLTVDEAERMLSDLAQRGHLDVRVEGSKLVYAM